MGISDAACAKFVSDLVLDSVSATAQISVVASTLETNSLS
jgi:hypothetical protein